MRAAVMVVAQPCAIKSFSNLRTIHGLLPATGA